MLTRSSSPTETRRAFCAAGWLAVALVAIKASYLGLPDRPTVGDIQDYVRVVAAISYRDVLLTAVLWASARIVLAVAGSRRALARLVSTSLVAIAAALCA